LEGKEGIKNDVIKEGIKNDVITLIVCFKQMDTDSIEELKWIQIFPKVYQPKKVKKL
jgi:hypothetical protein